MREDLFGVYFLQTTASIFVKFKIQILRCCRARAAAAAGAFGALRALTALSWPGNRSQLFLAFGSARLRCGDFLPSVAGRSATNPQLSRSDQRPRHIEHRVQM